jgi:hypothetical protein
MPRLAAYRGRLAELPFDFTDVLGAIAPRTVLINAPKGDSNFRWQSVDRVVAAVRPLWSALPARHGGLGVENPTETGAANFACSRACAAEVVSAIIDNRRFDRAVHRSTMHTAQKESKAKKEAVLVPRAKELRTDPAWTLHCRRRLERAAEEKINAVLTAMPTQQFQQDLSPREFRDFLAYRYDRPMQGAPAHCDGCGKEWSVIHALNCACGGLVTHRHDDVNATYGEIAALALGGKSHVQYEPVIREARTRRALRASARASVPTWRCGDCGRDRLLR